MPNRGGRTCESQGPFGLATTGSEVGKLFERASNTLAISLFSKRSQSIGEHPKRLLFLSLLKPQRGQIHHRSCKSGSILQLFKGCARKPIPSPGAIEISRFQCQTAEAALHPGGACKIFEPEENGERLIAQRFGSFEIFAGL